MYHFLPLPYQIPSLDNPPATPNKGPQSGGTNITIRGEHLGIGSFHNVTVANRECRIHEIRCVKKMCTASYKKQIQNPPTIKPVDMAFH